MSRSIGSLTRSGAQLGPFAAAVELLCTIPGVARRTAEVIIAETGGDMTVLPTARHLASWAGACPLAAQYRRLRARRGHKRALGAVKHSILVAAWHMLSTGELYREPGGDYFERRRDPQREINRLVAQLQRLGHTVTLQGANAA